MRAFIFGKGSGGGVPPEQPPLPSGGLMTGYTVWFSPGPDTESSNAVCSNTRSWIKISTDYGMGVNHYNWLMDPDVYEIPPGAVRLYNAVLSNTGAPTGWYVFGDHPRGVPNEAPRFWANSSGYINIKERCGY